LNLLETPTQTLNNIVLPTNKTEHYRHFNIKSVLDQNLTQADVQEIEPKVSNSIEITNGTLTQISENVVVTLEESSGGNENHFDSLYKLSHHLSKKIVSIKVTSSLEEPLKILHKITEDSALVVYRIKIEVAENVSASVFEEFDFSNASNSLLIYGYDLKADAYANLEFVRDQKNFVNNVIGSHQVDIEKNGNVELKTFDFSIMKNIHMYNIDLAEYANLDSSHLVYSKENATLGNVLYVNHIGKHSVSKQTAKYILGDSAHAIFDGKIRVENSAAYSSAKQNSKSLILGNKAGVRMYAKPQLEIFIDELEASHGSSSGQLDNKQLFYLKSRGINETEAKKMLILAFANELIYKVKDEALQEKIQESFNEVHTKG